LRILIIGGSVFLGRHLVNALLTHGHDVTLFNRGLQNPELFPNVQKLHGDRDRDLSPLKGKTWDAVVDTCGYYPKQVLQTAKILRSSAPRYIYVSSVNQYRDFKIQDVCESYPSAKSSWVNLIRNPQLTEKNYGHLKAGCEEVVRRVYGKNSLIIRPGYIVGPYDQSYRFIYWIRRVAAAGTMLVPGHPEQVWQIIDVRDLAEWIVRMLELGVGGTFNVVGPEKPITIASLINTFASVLGVDAFPVWVDISFLQNVSGGARWIDLAHWSNLAPTMAHLYTIDNARAVSAGLLFRPIAATSKDVLSWLALRPPQEAYDLAPERENELLRIWERKVATGWHWK
jgi:2'-hydroxyisoflavone reductase